MIDVKYLIIGAGVSGLAFANHIKDKNFLIVEKENEAGGYCRIVKRGDYIWDFSGHFFHFATNQWKDFFEERIDKAEILRIKKNTKIYYKGNLIDYPFQKNIHQLEKEEFIDCLYDLFHRYDIGTKSSFKNMLYEKFGKSISEKFLVPYNEKLYACDLNMLDSDAMGRFFPYADVKEIIDNMKKSDNESYNDFFLYPKGGAQTFVEALMRDISSSNILLGEEIIGIDRKKHLAQTNKNLIHYEKIVNTISLKSFMMLDGLDRCMENLSCNKVLVFNFGFDKKSKYDDIHWIYIPDENINFYRIGFYDNILNQNKLSMYVEIGYQENEIIDVDLQLQKTLENLKHIGIIEDHVLMDYHYCIMEPAYVHISRETRTIIEYLMKNMAKDNIYSIGRYGIWKYCSIEDCLIDADKLFEKLNS
jgi:protoporphyrinogen oxidase